MKTTIELNIDEAEIVLGSLFVDLINSKFQLNPSVVVTISGDDDAGQMEALKQEAQSTRDWADKHILRLEGELKSARLSHSETIDECEKIRTDGEGLEKVIEGLRKEIEDIWKPQSKPVKTGIWRLLEEGEWIQEGDEFYLFHDGRWVKTQDVGSKCDTSLTYRRRVEVIL